MKLKIFTVYDSKAESYMQPFYMQSTGQAIRSMEDTVQDENHQFHKHAEDFTLFEIGTFDDQTCAIDLYAAHTPLGCAIEYKEKPNPKLKGVN